MADTAHYQTDLKLEELRKQQNEPPEENPVEE